MPHIRLAIVGDSRITVEGFEVTPVASHLFALLLVLTHHPDKRISRGQLQDLLFPGSKTASLASHSLRQLLYRLRQTGLHFNETSVGLALTDAKIDGSLASLSRLTPQERARSGPGSLRVLPSYSPRLSPPFLEWLDCLRDNEQRKVLRLYLDDLARFRHLHSWANVIQLSKALLDIDPSNSDVVLACADALAMMGRRDEAIHLLDDFVADLPHDSGLLPVLRQLRSRIGKALPLRREASLHGRDSCLAYLEDEWLLAQSGGARQSSIVGHAGLGKTRVADAFAAHIALQGFPVLRYSCDAQSRQQPLSLFSDILPTLRQLRGSLGAAPEYKTALARLRPSSGKVELAMPGGSRDRVRSDIQEALIDLLEAVSAEHSLLLIVDDAHFLDDASCALLHSLTTSSNSVALQVLVCSRPSHSPLQPLAPSKRSNVYTLAPLDAKDSRDLLIELRAGRSADEDYVLWCLSQSAGNPFYIRTLAANDFESVHLPFDIRSLASSNYSSLSADSRATLETCLLLGRLATIPRVVAITAISDD